LRDWTDLAADSPPDAAWQPLLRERIAEVAKTEGIDPASISPLAATAVNPAPSGMEAGTPPQETVAAAAKAAADATPEERRAMIESMVARLASRLEQQPEDAEGWARLGRSYMVLRQPAKARDAYARAAKLRPDDAALSRALAEARQAAEAASSRK
jgi:cytochrome c-type biogenesis protein CcmH